jgi:hypothetical protein
MTVAMTITLRMRMIVPTGAIVGVAMANFVRMPVHCGLSYRK